MTDYWRKTYPVQAVRVTEENIKELARECSGDYNETPDMFGCNRTTPVPNITMTTSMAFVGDWVVKDEQGKFAFYSDKEFAKKYWTHSEEVSSNEKYGRIYQLVAQAMRKQDVATYNGESSYGMDLVAIRITKQIFGEL
jgi:hypothetical protein